LSLRHAWEEPCVIVHFNLAVTGNHGNERLPQFLLLANQPYTSDRRRLAPEL
jgi:hypothetical protein